MVVSDVFSAQASVLWDWTDNSVSGKTTTAQEAYKLSPTRLATVGGVEADYPFEVVDTRLRIRGRGRTAVVRYESSAGKDFVLIGHAMEGIEETRSEGRR